MKLNENAAVPLGQDTSDAQHNAQDLGRDLEFVLLLGSVSMIGPFAIDTLFPAFPIAAADLNVSAAAMQWSISSYLFAFALGSLIHGPLSDSFGRRPVLLVCLFGFVLASLGCYFAPDLDSLLLFRALQGFSVSAGTVISRALVRDRCDGARAQQITSQITLVFLLGPALAPIVGALILQVAEWRMIFGAIFGYALLVFAAIAWRLRETHPPAARLAFSAPNLLHSYRSIVGNTQAMQLIVAAAFNFGGLFLMIASAPAICFGIWKLTALEMWKLFVFAMGGILLGSQLSGRTAGRWSQSYTIQVGYAIMAVACALHLSYGAALQLEWIARAHWIAGGVPILLYGMGSSLAYPSLTILLMDRFPERRGAAASVQTFASLGNNGLIAGVISPLVAHHTLGLAGAQAILMLLGLLIWARFWKNQRAASLERAAQQAAQPR